MTEALLADLFSLPPMYMRSGWGMSMEPSALRLFSRKAISIRGGATTVLFKVWGSNSCPRGFSRGSPAAGPGHPQVGSCPPQSTSSAGGPGLHVDTLDLQVGQVARAALQRAHRDIQRAEEIDRVGIQLGEPRRALLGLADHHHLLLFKLVDAVDAALLDAVGADLLAEAGE